MRGDFLRLGLLVGAAVVIVGHFATQGTKSDSELFLFWIILGLGISFLVAFALERGARGTERRTGEEGTTRMPTGDVKAVATTSRFYAVSRMPSSAEMRALMVDAPAIPGNPISSRLQLIIERYDAYSRVLLTEGSLLDYSAMDIADHARDEALARLPATSAEIRLDLTEVRSLGPLDREGRSPFGWSYDFIDGASGVHCTATVTATQMLLVYRTAVTYPRPTEPHWLEPKQALEVVRQALPELAGADLQLHVELPSEYYLLRLAPFAVYEIDPRHRRLAAPGVPPQPAPERSGEPGPSVADLVALLTSEEEAAPGGGLREQLLACRRDVLRAHAERLARHYGPVIVQEIAEAAARLAKVNAPATRTLVNLVSLVSSDLAILALVDLADALPTELEGIAFSLFEKRRHLELEVPADPLEGLDFEESRALLGKVGCQRLALRSTYDPEGELLPGLQRLGLETVRVKLLSGDTELFLSANLVSDDGRTEGLLSSSPLPVPCHVLRLVGAEAEGLARRVREAGLHYSDERIVEDILQGRPYDLHRGALYLAALGIDAPQTFETLKQAVAGNRTNLELRRAALAALGQLSRDEVDGFLASLDDPDLLELARDLRARREARNAAEPPVTEPPAERPEPAAERPEPAERDEPTEAAEEPPKPAEPVESTDNEPSHG